MRAAETEQFRALSAKTAQVFAEKRLQLDDWQRHVERYRDTVEECTERYLQCGVAFYEERIAAYLQEHKYASLPGYFEELAKQAGRPLVYAVEDRTKTITLRVPKSTHKNLVAALLMVASTGEDPRKYHKYQRIKVEAKNAKLGDVVICDTPQVWWFYFHGNGGHEHFHNFLHQCHTNPVFRVALKLSNANLVR